MEGIEQSSILGITNFQWGQELPPQRYGYDTENGVVIWGKEQPRNLYPKRFEDMYLQNGNYRRIVEDIARGIVAGGIVTTGDQADELTDALLRVGVDHDYLSALAMDMAIFNGCASLMVWTKDTAAGLSMPRLHTTHQIKIARLRAAVRDTNSPIGDREGYWYAPDWSKVITNTKTAAKTAYKPTYYPKYRRDLERSASEVLYSQMYNPVSDYYPVPDGESVFNELQLDNGITTYQLNFVNNGMFSSGIIFIPFTPQKTAAGDSEAAEADRKRRDDIERTLKEQLTGTRKAGNVAAIFYNPEVGGVSVNGQRSPVRPEFANPVETTNDERFIKLTDMNREKMLTGLGVVSQDLLGINKATGFTSQSDTLITAEKIVEAKVYKPKRDVVIQHLNTLAETFGLDAKIEIAPTKTIDKEYTPEMVEKGLITVNEWREANGLASLETNDIRDEGNTEIDSTDVNASTIQKLTNYLGL